MQSELLLVGLKRVTSGVRKDRYAVYIGRHPAT